jgi:hypothetical protein
MKIRSLFAALLALFALLTLLDRFAPLEPLAARTGLPLLLVLGEGLAMIGFGALLRRAKRIDLPLDFLIGYPLFGAALYLVARMRVSTAALLPVLVLGAIAGVVFLLRWYAEEHAANVDSPVASGWAAAFVLAIFVCIFLSTAPLPIARTWVLEGRAVALPLLDSYFSPLGIESADLPGLTLLGPRGGAVASKLLHLLAAIAATALILRRTRSWLAAAAIVTTPALTLIWPVVGLFVALYLVLEDDDRDAASAVTAAGLLTSYTFLPFAILGWALKRRVPKWTALFGLIFFLRPLGFPKLLRLREVALADYVFADAFAAEALGAAIVALPVFATGTLAVASALAALALFFLAPSALVVAPYLAVASISAAAQLRRRLLAVVVIAAIVLQTFIVVHSATRNVPVSAAKPSIDWLNTTLPRESRTLVIGTEEMDAFARRVRGGDPDRVSRYLDLPTVEGARERLRGDGISHIAVIEPADEQPQTLSPAAQRMLAQLLDRYAGSVTSRGDVTLFALR